MADSMSRVLNVRPPPRAFAVPLVKLNVTIIIAIGRLVIRSTSPDAVM